MSDQDNKPELTTPAARAGAIPGIFWNSILTGMQYNCNVAKTEWAINPKGAVAALEALTGQLDILTNYILHGEEPEKKQG